MGCCDTHNSCTQIKALILDLDGTLLNTEKATKDILKDFLKKYGKVLDRDKEDDRLGMMHMESSASIVRDYNLPLTPLQFSQEIMPLFHQKNGVIDSKGFLPEHFYNSLKVATAKAHPGANRLIMHFHKHCIPVALASNSRTKNIEEKISRQIGWRESFSTVLGSDQVKSGKPSPDIFLEAAKRMGVDAAQCLVIEDSLVGVTAGKAAGMKVVAVPSLPSQADLYSFADSVLHSLLEFRPDLWGLPSFDDWVGNTLPIEPMYVEGQLCKGLLCNVEDDAPNALPDQASGVYFGRAKLSTEEILKAVVGIGWQIHSSAAKRVIQVCIIGDNFISDQHLQIVLVGYIRELTNESITSMDLILEEDLSLASEALDLPMFLHHKSNPLLVEASPTNGAKCSL